VKRAFELCESAEPWMPKALDCCEDHSSGGKLS
jgi:hypothetical protein